MKTFSVGCSRKTDIVLIDPQHTVSRMHIELTVDREGRYYITDCNSTNGTFRQSSGKKIRIQQDYVDFNEPLWLGTYSTSVSQLLQQLPAFLKVSSLPTTPSPKQASFALKGRIERNPETGEIIIRHD